MTMEFEKIADILKALAYPTRLKILTLLRIRDCCVCELVPIFNISQPAISKHVSRLKTAELVRETRKGQWVFYSINEKRLIRDGIFPVVNEQTLRDLIKEFKHTGPGLQGENPHHYTGFLWESLSP